MMTRPLDAAMAFANLHRRWFDDAQGVTDANRRQACDAAGSLVVDVLTLWDENECDYLADAPFLIRLEECDIAAFVMRRAYIALFIGRIESDDPLATFECRTGLSQPEKPSNLRWRSFRPCSYAIGRRAENFVLHTDESELIVELETTLDDGGSITIGGTLPTGAHSRESCRIWSLPHAV